LRIIIEKKLEEKTALKVIAPIKFIWMTGG